MYYTLQSNPIQTYRIKSNDIELNQFHCTILHHSTVQHPNTHYIIFLSAYRGVKDASKIRLSNRFI